MGNIDLEVLLFLNKDTTRYHSDYSLQIKKSTTIDNCDIFL